MNQRGVSPLVATLVLIGISALLGAVVMSYGKAYIEERAEFVGGNVPETRPALGCSNIALKFIEVAGDPQVCIDPASNTAKIFLEAGNQRVENMQVRVVGSSDIYTSDDALSSTLGKGQSRNVEVTYGDVGQVRQVKVTPYTGRGDSKQYCTAIQVDAPIAVC